MSLGKLRPDYGLLYRPRGECRKTTDRASPWRRRGRSVATTEALLVGSKGGNCRVFGKGGLWARPLRPLYLRAGVWDGRGVGGPALCPALGIIAGRLPAPGVQLAGITARCHHLPKWPDLYERWLPWQPDNGHWASGAGPTGVKLTIP